MTRVFAIGALTLSLASALVIAQVRDWPAERPPRPLAARPVSFPPYEIKSLANGMKVVVVRQSEQPVVSLRLLVRAGAAQDPKERPGVASMVASLLDQGTTAKSAKQIAETIDDIGGVLGTGAGTDLSYVSAIVMKDSLDTGLNLLSEVVRQPAFSNEELDRQKEQVQQGLTVMHLWITRNEPLIEDLEARLIR